MGGLLPFDTRPGTGPHTKRQIHAGTAFRTIIILITPRHAPCRVIHRRNFDESCLSVSSPLSFPHKSSLCLLTCASLPRADRRRPGYGDILIIPAFGCQPVVVYSALSGVDRAIVFSPQTNLSHHSPSPNLTVLQVHHRPYLAPRDTHVPTTNVTPTSR